LDCGAATRTNSSGTGRVLGRIARGNGKIPGDSLRDGVVEWYDFEKPAASSHPVSAPANWPSCDAPEAVAAMEAAEAIEARL